MREESWLSREYLLKRVRKAGAAEQVIVGDIWRMRGTALAREEDVGAAAALILLVQINYLR